MVWTYDRLLRQPQLRRNLLATLLSALPLAAMSLTLILSVRSWTDSTALAGTASGLFTAANAIGLLAQGWLLGRSRARRNLVVAGVLSGAALATLAVLADRLGYAGIAALCLIAGLAYPVVATATRASIPALVATAADRSAGYALLAVVFQVSGALAPVGVSALIGLGVEPAWGLAAAAILTVAAAVVARPADLSGRGESSQPVATPMPTTPASGGPRLSWLLLIAGLTGLAGGISALAFPTLMAAIGEPARVGLIFAAIAVGDVVGAVLLGGLLCGWSQSGQLVAGLGAAALMAVLVQLVSTSPWLVAVCLIAGVVGAPVGIRLSALLDQAVPADRVGLAYAALTSVGLVTSGLGTAAGGLMLGILSPQGLLMLPPTLLGLAALVALTGLTR